MKPFEYVRPKTIAEAVAAASEPGAVYLAAGTNLLDLMKGGVSRPSRLVDITHLPGLDEIENLPDGGVRIGALTRNAELAHDGFRAALSGCRRGASVGRVGATAKRRHRRRQSLAAHPLRLLLRCRQRLQ
jgi:CO/xanthine dehydrogenase FAD-binding subunit